MNGTLDQLALPPLQVADLDDRTLEALFVDIARGARVLDVRLRATSARFVMARSISLEDAHAAFRRGDAAGLQVRYAVGATVWCDTLTRGSSGVKLVRIESLMDSRSALASEEEAAQGSPRADGDGSRGR